MGASIMDSTPSIVAPKSFIWSGPQVGRAGEDSMGILPSASPTLMPRIVWAASLASPPATAVSSMNCDQHNADPDQPRNPAHASPKAYLRPAASAAVGTGRMYRGRGAMVSYAPSSLSVSSFVRWVPRAFTESSRWWTLLAPTMGELTPGWASSHETAISAGPTPRLAATSATASITASSALRLKRFFAIGEFERTVWLRRLPASRPPPIGL